MRSFCRVDSLPCVLMRGNADAVLVRNRVGRPTLGRKAPNGFGLSLASKCADKKSGSEEVKQKTSGSSMRHDLISMYCRTRPFSDDHADANKFETYARSVTRLVGKMLSLTPAGINEGVFWTVWRVNQASSLSWIALERDLSQSEASDKKSDSEPAG